MKRTFRLVLFVVLMLLYTVPVLAGNNKVPVGPEEVPQEPVVYATTIDVDAEGGRYEVGFVTVVFKKRFIDPEQLPVTFEAQVYAENGLVYIEFIPDCPDFYKKVHIRVDAFEGYLYDRATGENIYVSLKKQQLLVEHFSRYCFND